MKRILAALAVFGAGLVGAGAVGYNFSSSPPPATVPFVGATPGLPSPGAFITVPATGGNLGCGSNESGKISTFLNNLPSGSTVDFPAGGSGLGSHACYTIASSITLKNRTNLTINANGAIFNQWPPNTTPVLAPIFFVQKSSGVTINDAVVVGAWDGHDGTGGPCGCTHGETVEGSTGVQIQATGPFTMRNSAIIGTQGDCFSVQLPTSGAAAGTNLLNSNVNFSFNTENLCGYTSASVESVNGLTFANNTITNGSARDFSFEVDGASTFFACQSCAPGFAGILNATFERNTITDNNSVTTGQMLIDNENGAITCTTTPCHPACPANGGAFQTQTSGKCTYYYITEKNIAFTNNTIICNTNATPNACPLVNSIGTNPTLPPQAGQTRGLVNGFTFSGNVMTKGHGGAVAGGNRCGTDTGSIMYYQNVANLQVNSNSIPIATAIAGDGCPGNAYLSGVFVTQSQGQSNIQHNNFTGGSSSLNSNSHTTRGIAPCSNIFGPTGGSHDPPC